MKRGSKKYNEEKKEQNKHVQVIQKLGVYKQVILFSLSHLQNELQFHSTITTPPILWVGWIFISQNPNHPYSLLKQTQYFSNQDSSKSTALINFILINYKYLNRLGFDKRQLHKIPCYMQFYFMKIQIFTETSVDIIPYKSGLIFPT